MWEMRCAWGQEEWCRPPCPQRAALGSTIDQEQSGQTEPGTPAGACWGCFHRRMCRAEAFHWPRGETCPSICWKFLECWWWEGALLDPVLTKRICGECASGYSCCNHHIVEFKILKAVRRLHTKICILWTLEEQNLASPGSRIAWNKALEGRGAQASWRIFKDHVHQVQELWIPTKRKTDEMTRRLIKGKNISWTKKHQEQSWRAWKQGQVVWEEYKEIAWTAGDQVRKANALTELNWPQVSMSRSKAPVGYVYDKMKTRENMVPLLKEKRNLVIWDLEKVEVLSNFFVSFVSQQLYWQVFQSHCLSYTCRR